MVVMRYVISIPSSRCSRDREGIQEAIWGCCLEGCWSEDIRGATEGCCCWKGIRSKGARLKDARLKDAARKASTSCNPVLAVDSSALAEDSWVFWGNSASLEADNWASAEGKAFVDSEALARDTEALARDNEASAADSEAAVADSSDLVDGTDSHAADQRRPERNRQGRRCRALNHVCCDSDRTEICSWQRQTDNQRTQHFALYFMSLSLNAATITYQSSRLFVRSNIRLCCKSTACLSCWFCDLC